MRTRRWTTAPELRGRAAALCVVLLGLLQPGCSDPRRIDPDPPATREDDVEPPEPPLSRLDVPITIPVATLVGLLEEAVPTRFGTLERFHEVEGRSASIAYDLERASFRASLGGNLARVETTLRYRVRVSYDLPLLPDVGGSCGTSDDPRPRLRVAIESPISVDSEWRLDTEVRVTDVRALSDDEVDRCQVTFLGLDITNAIAEGARTELEHHLTAIDDLAAGVDIRSEFESWWATLGDPIRLDDELWLSMQPERVTKGTIRGAGDSVHVSLSLGARPRIVFGARPVAPADPLPPLDSGPVTPGLDLLVDARAEYGTAGRFLQERLGGSEYEISGRRIRLDSLRVYGIGSNRLAMELEVSGDVRGRLFLTGEPAIDVATGMVSVPDLELDVATRNVVLATVSWLADQGFRDVLRERATWPSEPAVRWLEAWLSRGLNRRLSEDLRVAGSVDSLSIVGVHAGRDALLVRISARGSARLFVEDQPPGHGGAPARRP